jgi:hypothetical protein
MIFISYGMQKSASTFCFRLAQRIAEASGNGQKELFDRYIPESIRNSWGKLTARKIHAQKRSIPLKTFIDLLPRDSILVVKTHSPPPLSTRSMRKLIGDGHIKVGVSYRDPRDCVVSMLDAGKKTRNTGGDGPFAGIRDLQSALNVTARGIADLLRWLQVGDTLLLPYSSVASDPTGVALSIAQHMGMDVSAESIVKDLFSNTTQNYYNFNVGKTGRFREFLTGDQIDHVENTLRKLYGQKRYRRGLEGVMDEIAVP